MFPAVRNLQRMFAQPFEESENETWRQFSYEKAFSPFNQVFLKEVLECEVIHPQGAGRPFFIVMKETIKATDPMLVRNSYFLQLLRRWSRITKLEVC